MMVAPWPPMSVALDLERLVRFEHKGRVGDQLVLEAFGPDGCGAVSAITCAPELKIRSGESKTAATASDGSHIKPM